MTRKIGDADFVCVSLMRGFFWCPDISGLYLVGSTAEAAANRHNITRSPDQVVDHLVAIWDRYIGSDSRLSNFVLCVLIKIREKEL